MKINRNILKILIWVEILLLYILQLIESYFYSPLAEMIVVNLLTGVIVTFIITYLNYNSEKQNLIDYFFSEMHTYYYSLLEIKKYINNSKKYSNTDVLKAIEGTVSRTLDKDHTKKSQLDFYFLFNTKKKKDLKLLYDEIYEHSFGIRICMVDIEIKFKEQKEKVKLSFKEKIKRYDKIVNEEIEIIDKGMFVLEKGYKTKKYWTVMKDRISNFDFLK